MKNMVLPLDDVMFSDLAILSNRMGMPRTVLVARLIDFAVSHGGVKAINDARLKELEEIDKLFQL